MTSKEPKLCSDCPLTKAWQDEALRRIRERQIIETNDFSTLKICMERRQILSELGLVCPYYNYGFDSTTSFKNGVKGGENRNGSDSES